MLWGRPRRFQLASAIARPGGCSLGALEEAAGARLQQRVVRPAQDRLCLSKSVNFARTHLLAHIVVLEQPIALHVQVMDVLQRARQVSLAFLQRVLQLLQVALKARLGRLLVREALGVRSPLVGGVLHQLLVVGLRVLLGRLRLGHLLVQVSDEQENHLDHPAVLPRLLGVDAEGLRRRRGGGLLVVLRDLHERHVLGDRIHRGALHLRWGNIHLGVVELVQAVEGHLQQLLGGGVVGHQLLVVGILLLPLLRRGGHLLVQRLDGGRELRDLLGGSGDALLGRRDARLGVGDVLLEGLLLVVRGVQFSAAVLLLAVVVLLLLLQGRNHLVDHGDDLLEADLLAAQRVLDEGHHGAARAGPGGRLLQDRAGAGPHR
mmetsp:Transcript_30687/g.82162  ORF Transcript_30687/g.82162 Transcript_30687/m.82162 type:complete len:375 (+) Transcript_30687:3-1127(+)